jgi:alcohol oxidase
VRQHLVMVFFCLNDTLNSSIDAGIKWRPTPSEVAEFGPEFQKYWESHFANAPDKPVLWMGISSSYVLKTKRLSMDSSSRSSRYVGDPNLVPRRKYYTVAVYTVSRQSLTSP